MRGVFWYDGGARDTITVSYLFGKIEYKSINYYFTIPFGFFLGRILDDSVNCIQIVLYYITLKNNLRKKSNPSVLKMYSHYMFYHNSERV